MNPTQNQVRDKIYPHVLSNVNELIAALCSDEKYMDELADILSQPDYEGPAYDAGFRVEERDDGFWITWTLAGDETHAGDVMEDGSYLSEHDAWENTCIEAGLDPYQNDALEHYIVTEWLANELEARGEMINRDFLGLTIWGRACSGQVILLDEVMVQITKNAMERMQ